MRVARQGEQVRLGAAASSQMAASRAVIDSAISEGRTVYGVTTGVGVRKLFEAADHDAVVLRQHVTPHPPVASSDAVRGAALRLVNAVAAGRSPVRLEVAERYVAALNADTLPPLSVGGVIGIGDLSPLAELAIGVLGDTPLAQGETIGLINQAAVSVSLSALALHDTIALLDTFDVALAMDFEALPANRSVLDELVEAARPYRGVATTLPRLRALLDGGEPGPVALQDPATFRGAPLVHAAARDALGFALQQLAIELNAHHANPYVDAAGGRVFSVGNWELQVLSTAIDLARIALAPVLTIACERSMKLLQASHTGLPEGLGAAVDSVQCGLSEHAFGLQSLTAEARLLAQPVSFELVSTTGAEGIEDRMTLLPLGARRLAEMVAIGRRIAAVSLLFSAQACDLRGGLLGTGTSAAHSRIRSVAPFAGQYDDLPSIEPIIALIAAGGLLPAHGRS